MKDPRPGISDKYITFFFSISKKLTKTSKLLITSEVKTMRYGMSGNLFLGKNLTQHYLYSPGYH